MGSIDGCCGCSGQHRQGLWSTQTGVVGNTDRGCGQVAQTGVVGSTDRGCGHHRQGLWAGSTDRGCECCGQHRQRMWACNTGQGVWAAQTGVVGRQQIQGLLAVQTGVVGSTDRGCGQHKQGLWAGSGYRGCGQAVGTGAVGSTASQQRGPVPFKGLVACTVC